MAGSLNHIVDHKTGEFTMDLIDNLGDAYEALEECYVVIKYLTGGKKKKVNKALKRLNFPEIQKDMTGLPLY